MDHLFPIICSFFLGSWSDTFGRKLLLYIFFFFRSEIDTKNLFFTFPSWNLLFLKGHFNTIFDLKFFHKSKPPGPLTNGLKYF